MSRLVAYDEGFSETDPVVVDGQDFVLSIVIPNPDTEDPDCYDTRMYYVIGIDPDRLRVIVTDMLYQLDLLYPGFISTTMNSIQKTRKEQAAWAEANKIHVKA